jgi:membrane-associated phospholipid phosphatase
MQDAIDAASKDGSAGPTAPMPMHASFTFRPFVCWPALLVAVATILISAVAITWPTIDQFIAAEFYAGAGKFPAGDLAALRALHFAGNSVTQLVIVGLLVFLIGRLLGYPVVEALSWRAWWFLSLSLALGPGLIINGLLKPFMNRPRPMQTDQFGGHQAFVPAWSFGETANRSFPSGEAAAAMYLVAFALVVPKAWRRRLATFALLWAFAVSLNRIALGAHYLSDVLVAWGLTLVVILLLRTLVLLEPQAPSSDVSNRQHPWCF